MISHKIDKFDIICSGFYHGNMFGKHYKSLLAAKLEKLLEQKGHIHSLNTLIAHLMSASITF